MFIFAYLLILSDLKVKNYLKLNILTAPHALTKMVIKLLKMKNQSYYYWNDIIFIDDFNIKFFKIAKSESRIGVDIYYIGYLENKLEYDINSVKPLYLSVKSLLGSVEKIHGSRDRYLVIDKSNLEVINVLILYEDILKINLF